jgi:heme-degrading monooxygenase HmoA
MHARMNRVEGAREEIDASVRRFEETLLPLLRGLDGYRGCLGLADRDTGTQIVISYWESEDAMRASEEAVSQPRKDAVAAAGARTEAIVERYEVTVRD